MSSTAKLVFFVALVCLIISCARLEPTNENYLGQSQKLPPGADRPLENQEGETQLEPALNLFLADSNGGSLSVDANGKPFVPTLDLGAGFFVSWQTNNADYVHVTDVTVSRKDPPPGFPYSFAECLGTSLTDLRAKKNSAGLEAQGSRTFVVGYELRLANAIYGSSGQSWWCDLGLTVRISARAAKKIDHDVIYSEERTIEFKTRLSDSYALNLRYFLYRMDGQALAKAVMPGGNVEFLFSSTLCDSSYSVSAPAAFTSSGASSALEIGSPASLPGIGCRQPLKLRLSVPIGAKPGKYLLHLISGTPLQEPKPVVVIVSEDPAICESGFTQYDIGCLIQ